MPNDSLVPRQQQAPSFDEFKEIVLGQGKNGNLLNQVATLHGSIPRLIRILHNFDPTGTASAIDQLLSEEKSEREQDNILRAIYTLAIKIWKAEGTELPSLSDEKFSFLYFVYVKSETNVFARVEVDKIQNFLNLPQERIISIGEYLDNNGLIKFDSWVNGITITHKGIVRIEADLLGSIDFPAFVDVNEIKSIDGRIRLRFELLQYLNRQTSGNTFQQVSHEDIAREMGLDHTYLITQLLPYLVEEGWVIWRTSDTVSITEEGIDRAEALST